MNSITSRKNSTILLLIALVAAFLFAVYYYMLTPKLDEVEAKERLLSSLTQEITSVQEQISQVDGTQQLSRANELVLRKKVPQTRAIEKVLLDIAQIEAVTGTLVETISFNNYDSLVSDSTITDLSATEGEEVATQNTPTVDPNTTDQETTEETNTPTEELPVSTIPKETLPAALKLVTFEVSILALDMKSLNSYLQEIEKIERVMKIDTVNISLPGEEDQLKGDTESTVGATVQITTFYYEGDN